MVLLRVSSFQPNCHPKAVIGWLYCCGGGDQPTMRWLVLLVSGVAQSLTFQPNCHPKAVVGWLSIVVNLQ